MQQLSRKHPNSRFSRHSLLHLSGSHRRFWDDIDSCRKSLGFTDDVIAERIAINELPRGSHREAKIAAWRTKYELPIYKALRRLGYSHRDLCS